MFFLRELMPALAVAAVIAAILLPVAMRVEGRWRSFADAFAFGAAYAGGHSMVAGWPGFPPADTTHWLLFFAPAAALAAPGGPLARAPAWLRASGNAALALGALWLLLRPKFQYGWTLIEGILWLCLLSMAVLSLGICLDRLARNSSKALTPVVLIGVCAAAGAALMLSGSMLLGQLALVLASALGAGFVVLAMKRELTSGLPFAPGAAVLLGGLLISGYFYAELPAPSALLLAGAPALALVPVSRLGVTRGLLVRIILTSTAAGVAVAVAAFSSPPMSY